MKIIMQKSLANYRSLAFWVFDVIIFIKEPLPGGLT
jgi:hypothetical protein